MHQTYVDVGIMARELQEKHKDYTRRKAVPFRIMVEQGKCVAVPYCSNPYNLITITAYKTVLHSYGLDSNPSSDDEANSDLEVMDVSI